MQTLTLTKCEQALIIAMRKMRYGFIESIAVVEGDPTVVKMTKSTQRMDFGRPEQREAALQLIDALEVPLDFAPELSETLGALLDDVLPKELDWLDAEQRHKLLTLCAELRMDPALLSLGGGAHLLEAQDFCAVLNWTRNKARQLEDRVQDAIERPDKGGPAGERIAEPVPVSTDDLRQELQKKKVIELREIAKSVGITSINSKSHQQLIDAICERRESLAPPPAS